VSGDVIGSKEEKLFRASQCTQSEATGHRIHTTLRFTRSSRIRYSVNCSKYSMQYGEKIQVASIKRVLIIRPITPITQCKLHCQFIVATEN
jgi:hypothetical protein